MANYSLNDVEELECQGLLEYLELKKRLSSLTSQKHDNPDLAGRIQKEIDQVRAQMVAMEEEEYKAKGFVKKGNRWVKGK